MDKDWQVDHLKTKNRNAFTLAEVLITLGIIGVVAAITIPVLVNNYNTKAWDTAASVFDRKLEEALKTMNAQSVLATHETTEEFVAELSHHLKTNKICNNDKLMNCFSETVYWGGGEATPEEVDMSIIKTAKNFGQKDWGTNIVGVQFASGVNALIAYNPTETCAQDPHSNQITGQKCLAILYDTSGEKNPNSSGKDLRSNVNVTSLGSGCTFEVGGTCYTTAPFIPEALSRTECLALKADLGINGCTYDGDSWAGAAKACGGVSKMPTVAQLTQLANYLYNGTTHTSLDTNKATSLGFKLASDKSFYVWTSKEYTSFDAYVKIFSANSSGDSFYFRYYDDIQAICVE